jgi:hypothetical protein
MSVTPLGCAEWIRGERGCSSRFLHLLFDDTLPGDEQARSFLAYVSAKGYSGSPEDNAFIRDGYA